MSVWEEEEGGEMVNLSALAFPLSTLGVGLGWVAVLGVKLPESVPGMVEGYSIGGWEENLTLLCSGVLGSWVA